MAPPTVSRASVKFPVFAASFAHNNPSVLVVGGGGGAGRSGVPNALAAFDTASRAPTLEPFAELQLSRDEDSVTCIAPLSTRDGSIVFAGINSSEEERLKGKNETLRAFELEYPRKAPADNANNEKQGKIEFLSKTQLFDDLTSQDAKKEGYQRLVRLSPPGKPGKKRIGAIASSLAQNENSIVIFAAVSNKPSPRDTIERIPLKEKEANDIDILELEDGSFKVAYCLDQQVYIQEIDYNFETQVTRTKLEAPAQKYSVPNDFGKKGRPRLRGLRWLSPSHILLLVNKPNRTGVELQVLRIYEDGMGSIILRKALSGAKQAIDMDVVLLKSDVDPAYQAVIGVATQDISLHILTIDISASTSLGSLHSYTVYKDVHDVQMTKLVWSPYVPSGNSPATKRLLRLASTSLSGSISVDTFEITPLQSRHILTSAKMKKYYDIALYVAGAFIALMFALMVQSLIDPEGKWTRGIIPADLRNAAGRINPPGAMRDEVHKAKVAMNDAKAPVVKTSHRLRDMLHLDHQEKYDENAPQKALVVHHDPDTKSSLSTEVHSGTEEVIQRHNEAKTWDDLSHAERNKWRQKLIDGGLWAVEEGETILKSIFFSEAAGLVGQVAQGVMHG